MARAAVVFVLAMTETAAWWRADDAAFARKLYRPMAASTRIETGVQPPRLILAIDDSTWIHRNDGACCAPA